MTMNQFNALGRIVAIGGFGEVKIPRQAEMESELAVICQAHPDMPRSYKDKICFGFHTDAFNNEVHTYHYKGAASREVLLSVAKMVLCRYIDVDARHPVEVQLTDDAVSFTCQNGGGNTLHRAVNETASFLTRTLEKSAPAATVAAAPAEPEQKIPSSMVSAVADQVRTLLMEKLSVPPLNLSVSLFDLELMDQRLGIDKFVKEQAQGTTPEDILSAYWKEKGFKVTLPAIVSHVGSHDQGAMTMFGDKAKSLIRAGFPRTVLIAEGKVLEPQDVERRKKACETLAGAVIDAFNAGSLDAAGALREARESIAANRGRA